MSIRAGWSSFRFLMAVTFGLTCIATLAIGLTIWWMHSNAIRDAFEDNDRLAVMLAEQTANSVQSIDLVLTEIKGQLETRDAQAPNDFDRVLGGKDTYQLLTERLSHLQQAVFIGLIDKNGRLVNTTNEWPASNIDDSDRDHFQYFNDNDDKGVYISNTQVGRITGTHLIFFSKRINDADNTFLGVVTVGVKLSYFQSIYKSVASLRDQYFMLLHRDGTIIVRYPDRTERAGDKLPATSPWYPLVSQGGGHFRSHSFSDGEARLVSVRPLRDYPLVVDIAESGTAALATWRNQAITLGIGTLLVMLCSGFLLRALSKQFRRVANSETTVVVKVHELERANAKVDAALNNMSQGLNMLDTAGRLVVYNERYLQMYRLSPDIIKPGCSIRYLVQQRIAAGTFFSVDPEKYIADLTASMEKKNPINATMNLTDGRVITVISQPIADGGWVVTHEDVTDKVQAENVIKNQKQQINAALNNMAQGICMFDATQCLIVCNKRYADLYGLKDEHTKPGTTLRAILEHRIASGNAPDDHENYIKDRINEVTVNKPYQTINRLRDGRDVLVVHRPIANGGWVATHEDITERKRTEDELRHTRTFLNTVIENVPIPIMVKDVPRSAQDARDLRSSLINQAYEELMGVSREQIIGKTTDELYPKEHADFIVARDNEALQSVQSILIQEHSIITPHKGPRLVTAKTVAIRNDDGNPKHLLIVLDDVTERKRAEQRIVHMAHYDTLTDLPNRATFKDTLDATLDRAATAGELFAVLSIDLDGFKETNDTYGHLVGDALLCEVARRLKVAAGGAFVARLGGDEFAVILAEGEQPVAAAALAERLLAVHVGDFEVEGHCLKLGMSIGVAIYPTDGTDAKILMINADAALYRVKAETRGTALFFEAEMSARLRERYALQEDLRSAIDHGELLLHYQPQVKMSGETIGFEALARWQCPKRGMVPPGTFIPIAEESSLIISVGEWILREACREAASWPQSLTIAVNISPIQFRHGDLPRLVHLILLETGLSPDRLELEITEGVMVNDFSRAVSILNRLKALGVRIAMDDFGTGYSSLSYLQAFSCDKIKIDRIFICDLETNHHSRAIVRAVIGLGRSLDLPILAEGVETEAQHAFLAQEGCDEMQGYLTGRPLPMADYAELVGRLAIAQHNNAIAG